MADKKQIGLTAQGSAFLAQIMEAELFSAETDAYRCGIAYALGKGLELDAAPDGGYQTKFNAAGGLDPYQEIRDLVVTLRPDDADRPYATAEKLAELGITEIGSRLSAHESLAEILVDLGPSLDPEVDGSSGGAIDETSQSSSS